MKRYLLLMLCLLVPSLTRAEQINSLLAKDDVCGRFEVIHINGIVTTAAGAAANLAELRLAYGNAHAGHLIAYALAYNQTRGLPTDLYQSMLQVIADFPGSTVAEWISSALSGMGVGNTTITETKTIAQRWADLLGFTRPPQYQDQDLADIILAIRQNHMRHGKLLLVPHSQGNLYANLVYDRLTTAPLLADFPPQSLLMAHIANAATTMRTGNHYVTTDKDLVIKAVRWAVPAGSTPNVPVSFSTADELGHNFIKIYLRIPAAKSKVINLINARLNALKTTAPDYPSWVRSTGSMNYCGALAPYYGPGPWSCWLPDVNNVYRYYYTNMIRVPVAGSFTGIFQPGSLADAEAATKLHSNGCYQKFIADRIAKITALSFTSTYIPGCGNGYPSATWDVSAISWKIHSSDAAVIKVSYALQPPVQYGPTGQDLVYVERLPTCRRT